MSLEDRFQARQRRKRSLFTDIDLEGEVERKETLPTRSRPQRRMDWKTRRFFDDMASYAKREAAGASYVPFASFQPTYDQMDQGQLSWYFTWRCLVRKGQVPVTDKGYLLLYVYELLSGFGWTEATWAAQQLQSLWLSYRQAFPELDRSLPEWIMDFCQVHQLPFSLPDLEDVHLSGSHIFRNALLSLHEEEVPLRLSFPDICSLCDYQVSGSRFYQEGHQEQMEEALPRALSLADVWLRRERGAGVLTVYGPREASSFTYHAYHGALTLDIPQISLSVKPYLSCPDLRTFIEALARHTEKILRKLAGYKGTFRTLPLEEGLVDVLTRFLDKEYGNHPTQREESPARKPLQLDFDAVSALREQSDAVRDSLEVDPAESAFQAGLELSDILPSLSQEAKAFLLALPGTGFKCLLDSTLRPLAEEVNVATEQLLARTLLEIEGDCCQVAADLADSLQKIAPAESEHRTSEPASERIPEKESTPAPGDEKEGEVPQEGDPLPALLEELTDSQVQVLRALLFLEDPSSRLEELAQESFTLPELLIDELNEMAQPFLDDILIDAYGGTPSVLEEYAPRLKELLEEKP